MQSVLLAHAYRINTFPTDHQSCTDILSVWKYALFDSLLDPSKWPSQRGITMQSIHRMLCCSTTEHSHSSWAGSKRSSNCPCRMIALRTCLRIPYAVTCLAYAGDFSDMALREAYAGTFFTFFICPHRNCLREPFPTCAKPYTSKLNIWTVFLFQSHHLSSSAFANLFANCILAFAGIGVIQIPFASFRGRSFETNVLVHCSPPSVSSDTKACPGGIVGWAYAGLTLTLRGPYADFTSTCWKFLHEI